MKLRSVKVKGFRSLKDVTIDLDDLTVLIGENDSGKSSVLDALELLLSGGDPDPDDYFDIGSRDRLDAIEVQVRFSGRPTSEDLGELFRDSELVVRGVWRKGSDVSETQYLGERPKDERVSNGLGGLSADEQKELIKNLDPSITDSEISNDEKRKRWFEHYRQSAPMVEAWLPLERSAREALPRIERYSAIDYSTPSSIIFKTLRQLYDEVIYQHLSATGEETELIDELQRIQERARKQITAKVRELESTIQRYDSRIEQVGYEPVFDFSSSLKQGEFQVDSGRGLHPLSKVGDGTKRRMFMAVTEWDREVVIESSARSGIHRPVIRCYDEPDTNLHYEAQRVMYNAISDLVSAESSGIQAVICTHSLTLIDRAPAKSIRLLSLNGRGATSVEKLDTLDDEDIERFLANLASQIGITNSIMFYERCYLLVEGETEEVALPILYKEIYGRSPIEDGVRIVNVRGTGSVGPVLKLFAANRSSLVKVMVDSDCRENQHSHLNPDALTAAGFDQQFIQDSVHFVGSDEFEDLFLDSQLAAALNRGWPKPDGDVWQDEEIASLREQGKLSKEIQALAFKILEYKPSKPELMRCVAEECTQDDISEVLIDIFHECRTTAGVAG